MKSKLRKLRKKRIFKICIILLMVVFLAGCTSVATTEGAEAADDGDGPLAQMLGSRSQSIQIVGMLTILSLAPSILIMVTGFTRIVIVLSFTKNALGMQQMPPNQVIIGLALFLTFFVMSPVLTEIDQTAIQPYVNEEITFDEALDLAEDPIKEFMLRQTYPSDLELFSGITGEQAQSIETLTEELSLTTLIPAFITSEIKRGMIIGFLIYIPFIVVDMVVASTLMAMGMMMLPPIVISLPFKVLLFVLIDGWTLTVESLITGFY